MKKQTKFGLVLAAAAVISVSVASLVCARGWVQDGADWYYVNNDNEYVTDTIQSSGNAKFYLGEDGKMMRDYFLEDYNENAYYFGSNGAMVTNTWVAVDSSIVENQDDYVPDNYWYYFQASGKAIKGTSEKAKKTTIDGKKYAFNEYGQMATGWFAEDGKTINTDDEENPFKDAVYYAGGDNDGVLRAGWLTYYDGYEGDDNPATDYTNLYFYFNTSNNKKYGYNEDGDASYKTINGRKYAFNEEGIMYSGWDVYNNRSTPGWESVAEKVTYFSGEDDGHQVKKGWVYTVPAETIDKKKYDDDEQVYMYFASSGDSVRDQFKKINGKWYVFDRKGIMKTGLVVWAAAGMAADADGNSYKYADKLDLDYAEGADVSKKGILQTDVKKYIIVNPDGEVEGLNYDEGGAGELAAGDVIKLHLFGDDGARKTGANPVEFADDTWTFASNNNGDKGSGIFSKKYYSLGVQLKANTDIRYGIYSIASYSAIPYAGPFAPQSDNGKELVHFRNNMSRGDYMVLTTGGAKQKGNNGAKKDGDGNYWLIDKQSGTLRALTSVNTHVDKSYTTSWKTKSIRTSALPAKPSTGWTTQQLIEAGLIIDGTEIAANKARKWKATTEGASVYFQPETGFSMRSFQSDFGDGANKWIPMGMLDNANKTVTLNYSVADEAAHAYEVTPNDDYFLNCYWVVKTGQADETVRSLNP